MNIRISNEGQNTFRPSFAVYPYTAYITYLLLLSAATTALICSKSWS